MDKALFEIPVSVPLVGCIAFGLIDRGTNVIQVRPISTCPLSCVFCSTNAGPKSKIRQAEYIVPVDHLVEEFEKIVSLKGRHDIEAHIDTVGDPVTYPRIVELVSGLGQIEGVEIVSMQTHGSTLNMKLLGQLSDAGLKRINLSLDALEPKLAKEMAGTEWYDPGKVVELMHYTVTSTKTDLLVAPVWVPGINDEEIPKIISLTTGSNKGKTCLPLGIQKYEIHKHGRKVKRIKPLSWRRFYEQLRIWEEEFKVKLLLSPKDFGIHKRTMLPIPYRKLEKIKVEVVGSGWLRREKLAVTSGRDRSVTLINAEEIPVGAKLKARIVANKHNILIAEPV